MVNKDEYIILRFFSGFFVNKLYIDKFMQVYLNVSSQQALKVPIADYLIACVLL